MATWCFRLSIWTSLFLSMTSSPAANRPVYKWYWTKTEGNGDFLQFSFKSAISALIIGTIDLISIFYLKMSLTSPIFPSTQVILTVLLQMTNNLTMFSFMMELTLSSVSHTKMKLQFNLHSYTLSIATEEKNEFSRHDIFHPEFYKPLFSHLVQQNANVYISLLNCLHPCPDCHLTCKTPPMLPSAYSSGHCLKYRFVNLSEDSVPLKVQHRGHVPAPTKCLSQEKGCTTVLPATATIPFVNTTARSCLAQKVLDLAMHILACRPGDVINH